MKMKKSYFLFALLLILILGVSSVAANNVGESPEILNDDSSMQLDDNLLLDGLIKIYYKNI